MNMNVLSPGRTTREAPTNCLEVQWRFLQHKNPRPPQFGSPSRKPTVIDPLMPSHPASSPNQGNAAARGSPSRLFEMFETQELEIDQSAPSSQDTAQESSLPESPRASRTLNDLMGETQRQAMLDRILADMEQLALEPTYARLGQPDREGMKAISPRAAQRARSHKPSVLQTILRTELQSPKVKQHKERKFTALWALADQTPFDDDDDDMENEMETDVDKTRERKRRQRRKLQQHNEADQAPLIFWQQSMGARSAADVPPRLIALAPSPPRRQRSMNIIMPRRSHSSRHILSSPEERRGSKLDSIPQIDASALVKAAIPSLSPRRRRRHLFVSERQHSNEPASVSPKAHYGAWYVPQTEWWALHQAEQQILADKCPDAVSPHTREPEDLPHCHGSSSPLQRQHKPPLPPAARVEDALSPSPSKPHAVRSPSNAGSRTPSASSRHGANAPSAPAGPLELQVAGIPQSYIGREYRAFILSTGSTMPQYLQ